MARLLPTYAQAVVVLEARAVDDSGAETYLTVATGVLLAFSIDPNAQPQSYAVFLVTNKHVIEAGQTLSARFNDPANRFDVNLKDSSGQPLWIAHPNLDVTVTSVNTDALSSAGAEFLALTEDNLLPRRGMEEAGVAPGDDVFVLGFPMGIGGRERKYVIVRSGVIARLDDEIIADTGSFLVDCITFPGNSGGPVLLHGGVTAALPLPRIIGIVQGYIPYTDTAVSTQTQRERITFEENSGLTGVIPIDAVYDVVEPWLARVRDAHVVDTEGAVESAAEPTTDAQ